MAKQKLPKLVKLEALKRLKIHPKDMLVIDPRAMSEDYAREIARALRVGYLYAIPDAFSILGRVKTAIAKKKTPCKNCGHKN